MNKLKTVGALALKAYKEWVMDRCDGLAAAMAFNAILALGPFVGGILLLAVGTLGEAWTMAHLMPTLLSRAGPRGAVVIRFLFKQTEHMEPQALLTMSTVGAVGLVIGSSGVFLQLQDSLETIWNVRREEPGIKVQMKKRFFGLVYALLTAVVIFAGLAIEALIASSASGAGRLGVAVKGLVVFLTFWALAIFIFKALPPVHLTWKQILPWTALIALLHLLGRVILYFRVGQPPPDSHIDVAESFMLAILWCYYASMVFLYGAELMRVYLQQHGASVPNKT
jgi:membrane protein